MQDNETKISFNISIELDKRLREIAAKLRISRSAFLRQIIEKSTSEVIDELAKEQAK